MSIEIIGILTLLVGVIGLYRGPDVALPAFVISCVFGSAAAVIVTGIGASVQPAQLLLGFLLIAMMRVRDYRQRAFDFLKFPKPGFWLLCCWAYGMLGAYFLPRLLGPDILVNAIGVGAYGFSFTQTPLSPTSGNFTQSLYFTADLVCFALCALYASSYRGARQLTLAIIAYCCAIIVFAFLDLVTYYSNTSYLLEFIRNSTYVIYTDANVNNIRRIMGSFSEASAFAAAAIGAFVFSAKLWSAGQSTLLTGPIAIVLLVLLCLCTASSAYVILPIVLALLYGQLAVKVLRGDPVNRNETLLLIFAPIVSSTIVCMTMLIPNVHEFVANFLETMVLDKAVSQSGIERARFNAEAFKTFLDTFGVGAGVGSVRASSFGLALLSNVGVPGAAAYILFFGGVMFGGRGAPANEPLRVAACTGAVGLMLIAMTTTAMIDMGMPFYIFCGLAVGAAHAPRFASSKIRVASLRKAPDSLVAALGTFTSKPGGI